MWTRWVTIHTSYGLPRAAQQCRDYLANRGIRVRLYGTKKGNLHTYHLQVPSTQKERALALLGTYKKRIL
ncbi:hypothetical protein LOK74_11595 [Brevibacillus humidisoli]|uniref:hypothetical protein n=1 Tax=Brevibacillus humidisoli TaxID=2895522 RepID=UPI001E3E3CD5|nr:hypothetical protein [Brevibacillus humidisoli]UFJ43083.1 hypothetical protein LOK74_11595 [Brevibacillus humidisoli]